MERGRWGAAGDGRLCGRTSHESLRVPLDLSNHGEAPEATLGGGRCEFGFVADRPEITTGPFHAVVGFDVGARAQC